MTTKVQTPANKRSVAKRVTAKPVAAVTTKRKVTKSLAAKRKAARRLLAVPGPGKGNRFPPVNKVVVDAKMLALITQKKSEGSRERGIYLALGISAPTWARLKREDPRIVEALERGDEAFHDSLVTDVVRMSKRNHIVAPLFLLKTRFGYRENDPADESRAQVVINLPGPAASIETYTGRTLDHEAAPALPAIAAPTTEVSRG